MKLGDFNKKSKGEQLFLLLLLFCASFTVLAITGCGGSSCEKPACGHECEGNFKSVGCSIPGCGGCEPKCGGCLSCITCDTACMPQSVKGTLACYHGEEDDDRDDAFLGNMDFKGITCDSRYRDGSCVGCGGCSGCNSCSGCSGCKQDEKSCYWGCAKSKPTESDDRTVPKYAVVFCGSTKSGEKAFGCTDGCIGCGDGEYYFYDVLRDVESELGVD